MAKTYIHVMQMTLHGEKPKSCRGCPMAKTYIYDMQITLHSKNLNHAEVAQWRKPISMLCKCRFIAKT